MEKRRKLLSSFASRFFSFSFSFSSLIEKKSMDGKMLSPSILSLSLPFFLSFFFSFSLSLPFSLSLHFLWSATENCIGRSNNWLITHLVAAECKPEVVNLCSTLSSSSSSQTIPMGWEERVWERTHSSSQSQFSLFPLSHTPFLCWCSLSFILSFFLSLSWSNFPSL